MNLKKILENPMITEQLMTISKEIEGETEQLLKGDYAIDHLTRFYGLYEFSTFADDEDVVTDFVRCWNFWKSNRFNLDNWEQLFRGFTYKYNPTFNYYRDEKITTTPEGKETDTTTFNGSEKTTNKTPEGGYTDTMTDYVNAETRENFTGVSKTENHTAQRNDEVETTFTGRNNKTEKTFDGRKDTTENHTEGNIGVSTSAQILTEEEKLRRFNLMDYILSGFVARYCFLVY